jgi:hypothetical protein
MALFFGVPVTLIPKRAGNEPTYKAASTVRKRLKLFISSWFRKPKPRFD